MLPMRNETLLSQYFGQFGNYGAELAIRTDVDGTPWLELNNHAYGETTAVVKVYAPDTKSLKELGLKMMALANRLEGAS